MANFGQNTYLFGGHEKILHNTSAAEALPREMMLMNYERAFIVSSRTLNTKTDVIRNIEAALGNKCVGVTDKVGEHAPLGNIVEAAAKLRDAKADVIIGVGGGSVIDFCKMLQMCLSEGAYTKDAIMQHVIQFHEDGSPKYGSTAKPAIRQILIPTTLATAEWTLGCTPVDEDTHLKATFIIPLSGPQLVIYDPEILKLTPEHLLLSTAIRGLDHAINSRCAMMRHPLADVLSQQAIKLYIENLPRVKADRNDLEALNNVQLATWFAGACQMSVTHGFSHWMVHILGPYADISHSDAGAILMLAQAKWFEGYAEETHGAICKDLGREGEPLHVVLEELLTTLEMPRSLKTLNVSDQKIAEMCQLGLEHPFVTEYNVRPIKTLEDITAVMALANQDI